MFFYVVILFTLSFTNSYAGSDCVSNYFIIHSQNDRKICVVSVAESDKYEESKEKTQITNDISDVDLISLEETPEENLEEIVFAENELFQSSDILTEGETLLVDK